MIILVLTEAFICIVCRWSEGRDAALRSEWLLSARHELSERHVQPSSTGRPARAARARLPALRARAHARGETGR